MENPKCYLCHAEMQRDYLGCYWFCEKHPAPADLQPGMKWVQPVLSDETLSKRSDE